MFVKEEANQDGAYATLLSRAKSHAARALVVGVTAEVLRWEQASGRRKKRRGPEAAANLRLTVERVIGDLLAAAANPERAGVIWLPQNSNVFTEAPVGLRDFKAVRDAMHALSLLDYVRGKGRFIQLEGVSLEQMRGKASRFRITEQLLVMAEAAGVTLASVDEHFRQEPPPRPLVLKTGSYRTKFGKVQGRNKRFAPTERTRELEAQVQEINDFLSKFKIEGAIHNGFRRVFNQGDDLKTYRWNKGGRLFSVWPPSGHRPYQQLSSGERAHITIDGETTCEIDIRACNLTIFCATLRQELQTTTDPYAAVDLDRDIAKAWTVASFGAGRPIDRWPQQTSEEYRVEHDGKVLAKECRARVACQRMLGAYPVLHRIGEAGVTWADLMFAESQSMVGAVAALMKLFQVPSLPVHDSLIVPVSSAGRACEAIQHSFHGVVGVYPYLTSKSSYPVVQQAISASMDRCRQLATHH
jgi:hypothetical protein